MYFVQRTKQFERSFRKISKSGAKPALKKEVAFVIDRISSGKPLSIKYKDHKLSGQYSMYRECHIRPDLLLIYQIKNDILVLVLIDIGSHSELFR